jgi:hypothetical protein
LVLTGNPAADQLDLVTLLLHTTSLRGNPWELNIPKSFLKPGAFHLQQIQTVSTIKSRQDERGCAVYPARSFARPGLGEFGGAFTQR